MIQLEWLPNEILLELFKYLHDVQLFCAFYNLNSRFNRLLAIHSRIYHFDFRSISKQDFEILCQKHVSPIIHRILYTLPYTFNEYFLANKYWSKSTAPDIVNYQSFDYVNSLTIMNINSKIPDFRNIVHLKLDLPLGTEFWSYLPSFNQLISLEITFIENSISISLQKLLDRSPRLHSICFGKFSDIEIISKLTSRSINRLDFLTKNIYKKSFNNKQCSILIHSSFGHQCKTLLIYVENRMDIIYLIKNMLNLRSLICQCKDDKLDDEFIHWLRRQLPSTYSIHRDKNQISNIRLWIH